MKGGQQVALCRCVIYSQVKTKRPCRLPVVVVESEKEHKEKKTKRSRTSKETKGECDVMVCSDPFSEIGSCSL